MQKLIKAVFTSSISSLISMMLGAATTKVIAVMGGPAGLGVYAQFRQIVQWLVVLATINGQNSIVRGAASREGRKRSEFILTVGIFYALGTAVTAIAIALIAPFVAEKVFSSADPDLVFAVRCISIVVVLGACASFVVGLINSTKSVRVLAIIQVVGALSGLILVYPLVSLNFGYSGYLFLIASGFAAVTLTGLWWLLRRGGAGALQGLREATCCQASLREHVTYSVAVLITGLAGSGAVLILRSIYVRAGGLVLGGVFDAAWTLSMMYVTLLLASFGTYYFPTLSQDISNPVKVKDHVSQMFLVSTVVGTLLVSFVVLHKPFVIYFLYSAQFVSSIEILRWMLLGDYLKITCFVFGMLLHVYAERRQLVISDLLFQGFLVGTVWFGVGSTHQIVGIAFAVVHVLYLGYIWRHATVKYGISIPLRAVRAWVLGFLIVCALSAWRWDDVSPDLLKPFGIWCAISFLYILVVTSKSERLVAVRLISSRLLK